MCSLMWLQMHYNTCIQEHTALFDTQEFSTYHKNFLHGESLSDEYVDSGANSRIVTHLVLLIEEGVRLGVQLCEPASIWMTTLDARNEKTDERLLRR